MKPMKKKKHETFTEQLRRLLAESGLSRYEIGRRSGVDEAALSRFANGQRGLTTESLDRLCDALGLELVARRPKRRTKKG
jgi:transcriptional regulator with XRE-family HTH domain